MKVLTVCSFFLIVSFHSCGIPKDNSFLSKSEDGRPSLIDAVQQQVVSDTKAESAQVGDFRYGGIIFWIDPDDDTKGLVLGLHDLDTAKWGCEEVFINQNFNSRVQGKAIGTGTQNTVKILNGCSEEHNAAELCVNSTKEGYTDWFLPSIDELHKIYLNFAAIESTVLINHGESLRGKWYWSSSEVNRTHSWLQEFNNGNQANEYKSSNYFVRAVRYFQ